MSRTKDIRRIFRLAKEVHNESRNYEGYNPNEETLYTIIFGTEKQAKFLIHHLRKMGIECHNENEYDEPKTMWSVITPNEI